jgi:hypothetical protein
VVLHFTVPALGFGEPRLLTCSRARPQPVVWIAPARARVLRVSAVLPGHILSPWFGEPRRVRAFCACLPCSPGTSSALGSASPGACARSARVCRAPQARPQPFSSTPRHTFVHDLSLSPVQTCTPHPPSRLAPPSFLRRLLLDSPARSAARCSRALGRRGLAGSGAGHSHGYRQSAGPHRPPCPPLCQPSPHVSARGEKCFSDLV